MGVHAESGIGPYHLAGIGLGAPPSSHSINWCQVLRGIQEPQDSPVLIKNNNCAIISFSGPSTPSFFRQAFRKTWLLISSSEKNPWSSSIVLYPHYNFSSLSPANLSPASSLCPPSRQLNLQASKCNHHFLALNSLMAPHCMPDQVPIFSMRPFVIWPLSLFLVTFPQETCISAILNYLQVSGIYTYCFVPFFICTYHSFFLGFSFQLDWQILT